MIKDPKKQESVVESGVRNLFYTKKRDSIISLINALEERTFNGRKLDNTAIQEAFSSGAFKGVKYIVEKLHEHPAITSKDYAEGLIESWRHDRSRMVFPILLARADQGDLKEVEENDKYKKIHNSVMLLMMQ